MFVFAFNKSPGGANFLRDIDHDAVIISNVPHVVPSYARVVVEPFKYAALGDDPVWFVHNILGERGGGVGDFFVEPVQVEGKDNIRIRDCACDEFFRRITEEFPDVFRDIFDRPVLGVSPEKGNCRA